MEVYMGWSGVDCSVCQPLRRILSSCQDSPWPPPSTWCDVNICTPPCRFITKPQSEPQIVVHQHLLSPSPRSSNGFVRNDNALNALHNFSCHRRRQIFSLFCNSQHVLAFKWSRSTLEEKSFALLDFSSNRGEEWIGKETEIKSFLASPPPRHFAFFEAARIVTERVRWREGDGYRWIFQATDSENIMMSVEIPSQAMSSSSLLFPRRRLISLSEGNENHLFSPILRDDLKFCRDRLVPGHPAAWLSSSLNNLFNYRIPSPWKAFLKLARRRRLWNMANFKSWRETY